MSFFFVPEDVSKAVEYNFIVRPGGKVSDIRMKFNGVKTELVDGKIKMETRFGSMEETLPLSWTEDETERKEIAIAYKKVKKNVYGFEGGDNIGTDKTIVIDPVPIRLWGTYYGGSDFEFPYDIQIDDVDGIYLIGSTKSISNIATSGSAQPSYSGDWLDNFITKFNSNGDRLWGTYALIHGLSSARTFALDSQSNVYMGSRELVSTNLATPGAYQTLKNAYHDTYLMKYSNQGFLLWATYYGGNQNEELNAIHTDSSDNVYIVGYTSSTDVFSSPGAHQTTNLSTQTSTNIYDGFIAKFSPTGQRIWGTFFGGGGFDGILTCVISDDDFLYVTGTSIYVDNNVTTPGSFMPTIPLNEVGQFLAKFSLNGDRIWATFTGVKDYPLGSQIKGDNLYVNGYTPRTNLGTPGTFFENIAFHPDSQYSNSQGNFSGYITKFNVQTQQMVWGTYFPDRINKIVISDNDEVFFSGQSKISTGITTPNTFKPNKDPNMIENFIVKLNNLGQLEWGTYYGGYEGNIDLDSFNNLYLYGLSPTAGNIATPGSYQNVMNGIQDVYLVKFRDCIFSTTVSSNSPVCISKTITLTANGGTNYSWTGPNGFTSALQNPIIPSATTANSGEYFCTITGTGDCDDTFSVNVTVGDNVAPVPDMTILSTISGTCDAVTIPAPTATDACFGVVLGTTTSPLTYTIPGTYTVVWNYTDGTNVSTQNQNVVINPQPLPSNAPTVDYCIQENKTLSDISVTGVNLQWYDALTSGNLLPVSTLLMDGEIYYVSQTINGCESERVSVAVTIHNTAGPTGIAVQSFCVTEASTLANFNITGNNVVFYDSPFGGNILPMNTPLVDTVEYWASQTVNGCESSLRTSFVADIISDLPANNFTTNVCDDLNDGKEKVDFSFYNEDIIPASSGYSFRYYTDFASADNEVSANEITDFDDYELLLGFNSVYVRVENTTMCYKVVELRLTLIAAPILQMKDTYGICVGSSVTITADAGFHTYTWSDTSLGQSITVGTPGTYSVTVTEFHGDVICSTTKTITVVASDKPTITSIETTDWTASHNILTVIVSGIGNYEYSLDGEHYQSSNQFTGLENGEYTVYVHDINGCGIDYEDVYLLMYPKFFTPNGDNYNDTWGINFYKNELKMKVKIYDRQGKLIKQLTDTDPLWDGTYNGQILPATDYWFSVIREDGKEHTGHFSLKR